MRGQRTFDASGTSKLSAMDLGVGVGVGLLVPMIAEGAIARWGSSNATLTNNARYIAGGIGVALSLPLYWWRGLAPTMVAAAVAITYAVLPTIRTQVTQLVAGSMSSTGTEMGRLRSARLSRMRRSQGLGKLQSPRMGGSLNVAPMAAAGNF